MYSIEKEEKIKKLKIIGVIAFIVIVVSIPFLLRFLQGIYVGNRKANIDENTKRLIEQSRLTKNLPENFIYVNESIYVPFKDVYVPKEKASIEIGKCKKSAQINSSYTFVDNLTGLGDSVGKTFYETQDEDIICSKNPSNTGYDAYVKNNSSILDIKKKITKDMGVFYVVRNPNESMEFEKMPENANIITCGEIGGEPDCIVVIDCKVLRLMLPGYTSENNIIFKANNKYYAIEDTNSIGN